MLDTNTLYLAQGDDYGVHWPATDLAGQCDLEAGHLDNLGHGACMMFAEARGSGRSE
jgi:hypothetical protein